ncbi:MAG: GNAT family N-acetyltransferase [Candidatus Paceibacterota bacterium]|jgi:ribosomal protein S18 acetylase RimI-like enzyme
MIEISQAKPEDAAGAQQVFYKTWLDTYPNEECGITAADIEDRFKDRITDEGIAKMADKIANPEPNSLFLLAKDGNKIVGVCRALKNEEKNQLTAIYVLPEYQGRGVGQMFWQKVKKFFDPNKKITVEVATYNQKGISFYQQLGFVDTGRRFSPENTRMKSGSLIPEMEMVTENNC